MTEAVDQLVDRGDDLTPVPAPAPVAGSPAPEPAPVATGAPAPATPPAAEAEAEVETKGAKAEDAARDDKGRFIPKSRVDEMVTKERMRAEAAERELQNLKSQMAQVSKNADIKQVENEIVALEKARAQALLDADVEAAAQLALQIRMKDETVRIARQQGVPEQIKEEMREELRWESAVKSIEDSYSVLKPGSEDYDQDIVDMILLAQDAFVNRQRMKPSEALVFATEKVMGKFKGQGAAPASPGLEAGKNPVQDRAKTQLDKNLDTLKKQPPDLADAGLDSDKLGQSRDIDVSKLTSEEFASLPESTKARLRGDLL